MMIPEQVCRKLDAGQGHIVGQVAVYLPVEPVGQIRAAQVEAGSKRGKGQVLLQMQVDIVDDIADDHRIACGRVLRHPVAILLQHLDHKGLLLIHIRTHNTDLKKRLAAYAGQYPDQCCQTDADPETGCMEFEIAKGRFSFRLTAPYNEERREAARRSARENKATDRLK